MNGLTEIIGYDKFKKQIVNLKDLSISLPPLEQLRQIILVDHKGRPFVFKLFDKKTETDDALDDTISCENLSVDINDIKEVFRILTDEQRQFVMHVYFVYKNRETFEDNPKIILQGPAGAGKSTIINLIEKLITWEENKSSESPHKLKVLKCAFTGKAASNIEGFTLNHMFSIPIYKTRSLAKKRLDSKKEILENCIFFICDEISMVGERLMNSVNMRLQQIFENEKLYGDRFVLLVGDLYQIDPVRQKPVYPNSELWTCCEFYELTKIIRQQDQRFINALNHFRDSEMTEDDIALLRSREIEDFDEVPDSVIHLFYRNNHVDAFNDEKISKSREEEIVVNAIAEADEWKSSPLRVKIGIRYMITNNMDVGDGLANGTTGIVKGFDYDKDGSVNVIWMKFHSITIGRKARSEYYRVNEKPGFEDCVPIHRSSIWVEFKSNNVKRKMGNMFPLKAAEAITVHKSQGQTYHDGVCVHITNDSYDKLRTDKTLQYVALTRVTKLENLYILGSIDFSLENSRKFIRTQKELNRLRCERPLKLSYETFEDKTGDVIVYLNTGLTYNEHYEFITTDKWYSNASLLIFTETNTIESDIIEIPNYELAFRSDYVTALRMGGGIFCYKDPSKSLEHKSSMKDSNDKIRLSLFLYENYLYIITGVKGNIDDKDFQSAISELLNKYVKNNKCILFIGNFNAEENIVPPLSNFLNNCTVVKKAPCDGQNANDESRCDIVFTRNFAINQNNVGFYEYIPSSHKAIFVELPVNTTLRKDNTVEEFSSQGSSSQESNLHESNSQRSNSQGSNSQESNSQESNSQESNSQDTINSPSSSQLEEQATMDYE